MPQCCINDSSKSAADWAQELGINVQASDTDKIVNLEYIDCECATTQTVEYLGDPVIVSYKWGEPAFDRTTPGMYPLVITVKNPSVQTVVRGTPPNSTTCTASVLETAPDIQVPITVTPVACDCEPLATISPTEGEFEFDHIVDFCDCLIGRGKIRMMGTTHWQKCYVERPGPEMTQCGAGFEYKDDYLLTVSLDISATVAEWLQEQINLVLTFQAN
ncbi:MAG: hypothetical protein N2111_00975 [Candidatus Sumerlaeaceae bacterium]|nr:hypothetical protein [Candidatus Sumerlaeaceae bacterium]